MEFIENIPREERLIRWIWYPGTFARVWLARLSHPVEPERERVYALKILRKVDSKWPFTACHGSMEHRLLLTIDCSYSSNSSQASRARAERALDFGCRCRPPLHHHSDHHLCGSGLSIHAGTIPSQSHPSPRVPTNRSSLSQSLRVPLSLQLDYCPGGEVFTYLRRARRFNEPTARFYSAEIVLILEFLHEIEGIAYRDLKPENILLDSEGHLKLVDFGFAKRIGKSMVFSLPSIPLSLRGKVN